MPREGSRDTGQSLRELGDATLSLHCRVLGQRGAANTRCHPWAQQQPCGDTQLLAHSSGAALPARPCSWRKSPAQQRHRTDQCLLWLWALGSDCCWLLPGELTLQGPELPLAVPGWMHSPSITREICSPESWPSSLGGREALEFVQVSNHLKEFSELAPLTKCPLAGGPLIRSRLHCSLICRGMMR